ncbi:unnamed protein product [Victoria cruziana]
MIEIHHPRSSPPPLPLRHSLRPRLAAFFSRCHNLSRFPPLHSPITYFGYSKKCRSESLRFVPPVAIAASSDRSPFSVDPYTVRIPVGDRHIVVETGLIGRQASGSVTVTDGETIIYSSVCLADIPSEPSDFFPLSVTYQERFSAAGRTSGGFFKREGRTKDHEVLVCRLIDRPLRPTMLKGFYHETQILSWVLSYDGLHPPDSLAITAAGIAVALSEVPISKPVAGVRIGLVGDQFIINPTTTEMENSKLDMLVAGTDDAILMIEGYCDFLTEEMLLKAVEIGQGAVRKICKEVQDLVKRCGKPKMIEAIKLPPPELYSYVEEIAGDELVRALQIKSKIPRSKALAVLEEKILSVLAEKGLVAKDDNYAPAELIPEVYEDEDEDDVIVEDGEVDEGDIHIRPVLKKSVALKFLEVDVKLVFKEVTSKFLRRRIVEDGKRSDGRNHHEIRFINSRCGLLPRAHGSALFTRGETQYSFPPSCVGEVGRIGAPSRREIGHGTLAERALEPILPSEEDFPYTVRVESTITESNGSSSMASVCGGCLALLDAGVPIKRSVAGIAMGMVLDTKEFGGDGSPLILSDISGSEDASGDMDFKVAGDENGITAFQMDIKVGGISLPVMEQVLLQARDGRKQVLAEMLRCSPPPAKKLSKYAPLIHVIKVKPEKLNIIIGTGGKKVKSIIEESGVENIDTEDNGLVKITAKDLSSLEKSKVMITNLTMVPTVGDIYRNCEIKSIAPFGVIVEIAPGREVFKVGDRVDVKVIEINERGQVRLSRRALLPDADTEKANSKEGSSDAAKDVDATYVSDVSLQKSKAEPLRRGITLEKPIRSSADGTINKDGSAKSQKNSKIYRRSSSSQGTPVADKESSKKGSAKKITTISADDGTALLGGEARTS